jgi:hypothetical protein
MVYSRRHKRPHLSLRLKTLETTRQFLIVARLLSCPRSSPLGLAWLCAHWMKVVRGGRQRSTKCRGRAVGRRDVAHRHGTLLDLAVCEPHQRIGTSRHKPRVPAGYSLRRWFGAVAPTARIVAAPSPPTPPSRAARLMQAAAPRTQALARRAARRTRDSAPVSRPAQAVASRTSPRPQPPVTQRVTICGVNRVTPPSPV